MIKKIIIYGLGIFFSKIITFFLIPVYTRCFSPTDYGYYDVLISNLTMVVSISFIEIWSGIIRFMFDDERPYRPVKSFLIILPFLLIFYAVALVVLAQVMELKFIALTVGFGLSYLLFTVFNSICRGLNKNIDYVISGVISTVLSCGLGILFVVGLKKGIASLLVAQIIGYLCATIYVELRTRAVWLAFKEQTSKIQIKDIVLYSLPLMLNSFSFLFLGTFNKNVVLQRLGEDISGYYAFALKFTSILSVLISVFSLAWQEVAFQNSSNKNRDELYTFYINVFMKFIGLLVPLYCLILYYAAPIIGGAEYVVAVKYIPLAVFATFISEVSGVLSTVIAVSKKGIHILLSTIIGAAVNVIIILFTIEYLGINAASIAMCVGFLLAASYRFFAGRKYFKIKFYISFILLVIIEMAITLVSYHYAKLWLMLTSMLLFVAVWVCVNWKTLKEIIISFVNKARSKNLKEAVADDAGLSNAEETEIIVENLDTDDTAVEKEDGGINISENDED